MTTARLLLALAALVLVSGCSQSDSLLPCEVSPPSGPGGPLVPHYLVQQGVQASIDVSPAEVQAFSACDDEVERPSERPLSVTAQVFDPDNNLLSSEVSLASDGRKANVRFTPLLPGRHHVIVSFAPVGSLQQLAVHVARGWSGTSSFLLPLPRCAQLDRTARGTWVCDGVALREPGGRQVRLGTSSTPPDVAIAGNVVWVVGDGRVRRYVDTGTELELTGSLLLNLQNQVTDIQSRLAMDSELWVLGGSYLHRFIFTDTGVLTAAPQTLWAKGSLSSFGLDGVRGLLVRVGAERMMVVQVRLTQDSGFFRFDTLACPYQLAPGPAGGFIAASDACQELPSSPAGYEEGVLWTASRPDSQTLHRWVASEGKLVEQASLVLGQLALPVGSLRAGFTVPVVQSTQPGRASAAAPVLFPQDNTLGLQLLPSTSPTAFSTLSPRYYFHGATDAPQGPGTTVHERPVP